jgi:hypothetical protein
MIGTASSPGHLDKLLIGAGEGLQNVTADILLYKLREREKSGRETLADVQLCRNGLVVVESDRIVSAI